MKKLLTVISVALAAAWCLLVLLSWLLSAMMVEDVRSLLTGEGLRWLFAHFADGLATPVLVWLLLAAMAGGCLSKSGLIAGGDYRRKAGLRVAALIAVLYVGGIALLVVPPHAVLLSATGTLAHSPFSRALVPLLCLGVLLCCIAYGLVSRSFTSATDIITAMTYGLRAIAPLLLVYVLAVQLLRSLGYVIGA